MGIKSKTLYNKIRRNTPYFEDFITRSIYNSNAIEGNTISYAGTYAIVFNDNSMRISATAREIYEAINLKYAFNYALSHMSDDLSLKLIRHLGVMINKNIDEISGFRTEQVFIRGAAYIPPSPQYVTQQLSELIYKGKSNSEDVFEYLARFHIAFERIHPFKDGNGRVGRLILCREAIKRGYAPVVIPLEFRERYFDFLGSQDITALAYMLRELNKLEVERMWRFGLKI